MKTKYMKKTDLIATIDALNLRLKELNSSETRQSTTESELFESDKKFQNIFRSVPIGLVITSLHGDVMNANQVTLDLLGYSPDEAKTMNVADFYTNQDDRSRLLDLMQKDNRVFDFETTMRRKTAITLPYC